MMDYLPENSTMPLTTVRRVHLLPVPGEVLVQVGDRVEPTEVVAHADIYDGFYILPVARRLGVPVAKVSRYLHVELGDEVRSGQTIAKRPGLAGRTVRSPVSGIVTGNAGGRLLIEAKPKSIDLVAYVPGVVTRVIEGYGAEIEAQGALVKGAWGVGGETRGVLRKMAGDPAAILREEDLDAACQGAILIGGAGLEPGVLKQIGELQVRGIVLGSLAPEMLSGVRESPIPIVVTEGIGRVPMSAPLFHLLAANDGREASVSGRMQTRWNVVRPEVFIPLPADTVPTDSRVRAESPVTVGAQVRVLRLPYMGQVGTIVDLPKFARRIATGARVRGAEVKLESADLPVFVPLANLEIMRVQ